MSILAPIINPISTPVSSLLVDIGGESASSTSGFIYSPSGGVFTSGYAASGVTWDYKFNILSENEIFTIQAYDASGNVSPIASQGLPYAIIPPVIITPGTFKTLTNSTAASGSTTTIFQTLSGEFITDGVIIGDVVLGVSGKNINQQRDVVSIFASHLVTDAFLYPWEPGDQIKVYSLTDRPAYNTNSLSVPIGGTCSSEAAQLRISTALLQNLTLYSTTSGPYVSTGGLQLNIQINGYPLTFTVPSGSITSNSFVTLVNANFPDAFFIASGNSYYIQAQQIIILDGTANTLLGLSTGSYSVGALVPMPTTVKPQSSTDQPINFIVDTTTVTLNLNLNQVYARQDILNAINTAANKQVAFYNPNGLMLLGSNLITITQKNSTVGFSIFYDSLIAIPKNSTTWSTSFTLLSENSVVYITEMDLFYRPSATSISIDYKMTAPILSTTALTVPVNAIDLTGTVDPSATALTVNGTAAFLAAGGWDITLQNLTSGNTTVTITATDSFNSPSNPLITTVNFTDPNIGGTFPTPPATPAALSWHGVQGSAFAPIILTETADFLDNHIFAPILTALDVVSTVLDLVKAFLTVTVLGDIAALRLMVQELIDQATVLLNIFRGKGLYILSTFPGPDAYTKGGVANMLTTLAGGFPNFINKVVTSFDDTYDVNRPQFDNSIKCGAFVMALSSGSGVGSFLQCWQSIMQFVKKTQIYFSNCNTPINLKASSENNRVVLTWDCPDVLYATTFEVWRTTQSGGGPLTAVTNVLAIRPGGNPSYQEDIYDLDTAALQTQYQKVGSVAAIPLCRSYKFIDGIATQSEQPDIILYNKIISAIQTGATSIPILGNVIAVGEDIISGMLSQVSIGQSAAFSPKNGTNYYYKIVPKLVPTDVDILGALVINSASTGGSKEVLANPKAANLVVITEDLTHQAVAYNLLPGQSVSSVGAGVPRAPQVMQFPPRVTKSYLHFKLSSAVYDPSTGLVSGNVNLIKITINGEAYTLTNNLPFFDNSSLLVGGSFNIDVTDGLVIKTITVSYTGKLNPNPTTKAQLVSTFGGTFNIINDDLHNNLQIKVGLQPRNINLTAWALPGLTDTTQTVRFFKDWTNPANPTGAPLTSQTLTAFDAVTLIKAQTVGVKVYTNALQQIVLEDNSHPNQQTAAYIQVMVQNPAFYFLSNASSKVLPLAPVLYSQAGPTAGTPPDWYQTSMVELFPQVEDVLQYISNKAQSILSGIQSATNSLIAFITLLQQKVQALSVTITEIKNLIDRMIQILSIQGGFYTLQIPANIGGNNYIKTALQQATGTPAVSDYAGGFVFLSAEAITLDAFSFIVKPLFPNA